MPTSQSVVDYVKLTIKGSICGPKEPLYGIVEIKSHYLPSIWKFGEGNLQLETVKSSWSQRIRRSRAGRVRHILQHEFKERLSYFHVMLCMDCILVKAYELGSSPGED